jgi:CelD/BcsL family acetyltransferase involved in cellulose biosynthesis
MDEAMSVPTIQPVFDREEVPVPVSGPPPSMLASVVFDVVTSPAEVMAEWRALEALPRNSLNQSYGWCVAWWAAYEIEPVILRGQAGGRTVMLLPLEIVSRQGLKLARFPGGRFNNINTGLFSADFPDLAGANLTAFKAGMVPALAPHADLLLLDCIPESSTEPQSPLLALAKSQNPNPSFQLPLRPTMDQTIAQLNAKTRRKRHRSQCRRLEAIGGFSHHCPIEMNEQHALLDRFFEQKAERFAALGLPDVFQPPAIRRFFHELINRSAGSHDYPLRMHALRLHGENEGTVVAISGVSRKGGHILCQFGSIDDKLCPDATPGELLYWMMIEEACADGVEIFDFGVGDQPYKHSWCPVRTASRDIMLPVTARGRLAMPAIKAFATFRMAVKRNPRLYGMVQKVRSLLRP